MAGYEFTGPMLGQPYEGWPKGVKQLAVQPKLDGYRLLAQITDGRFKFYCRKPKQVEWANNLGFIKKELLELGFDNCIVDGEIAGPTWNETGLIKRLPSPELHALLPKVIKYHVFDLVHLASIVRVEVKSGKAAYCDPTPMLRRAENLKLYLAGAELTGIVCPVETTFVTNHEEALAEFARHHASGREGAMFKHCQSAYNFVKGRSWLKMKKTKTFEVRITGCEEAAEGKYAGMLGAFVCVDAHGNTVRVGTGQSAEERADFWVRRDQMVGVIIEVKAQDDDVAEVARHPVFVRVRDDKDSL